MLILKSFRRHSSGLDRDLDRVLTETAPPPRVRRQRPGACKP